MTKEPRYGAGLWHFAQYVDRYATDGYGPPVTTLEAIDLAGRVGDLAVVDINGKILGREAVAFDIKAGSTPDEARTVIAHIARAGARAGARSATARGCDALGLRSARRLVRQPRPTRRGAPCRRLRRSS